MTFALFDCPWCAAFNAKDIMIGADIDVACSTCKRPIEIEVAPLGGITKLKRANLDFSNNENRHKLLQTGEVNPIPSINIGTNFGSVAIGGNASMAINIYEQTLNEIERAKNIESDKKVQAKGILDYVNKYAHPFLPIVAAAIKHGLGLS